MHSSVRRICSIVAMLVLGQGFTCSAWAQTQSGFQGGKSWQIGDFIVCFGSGTCNAIRIVGGSPVLLDQFSSGLLGATGGVATNNTLHAVVTDNGGSSDAKVVVYSIASVDPTTGNAITHTPVKVLNAGGGTGNAQAVALNGAGQYFVGNAGSGASPTPSIVRLNADGSSPTTFSPSGCVDTGKQLASIDLGADGGSLYITSGGGSIQKLSFANPGSCTSFAKLGSGVTLNGVKDIPANALPATCQGTTCPSAESILVVAKGFFDSNGNGVANASDVNVCTNVVDGNLVSCALLLTTSGPGLTASPWIANHSYSVGNTILDANLHVQKVTATSGSGKSGTTTPGWSTTGGTTIDNKVTWTDQGTSVVARYTIPGVNTIRSLALDPLVTDCTGNACASTYAPAMKVSNFSLGDNGSSNFYRLAFASGAGSTVPLNANVNCASIQGCQTFASIQSIGVYGGEGANQPGLARLLSQQLTPASGTASATPVTFLQNTTVVTLYNLSGSLNLGLYSSLVPATSCFNDQNPALACRATTSDPNSAIVWKIDVPQGSGNSLGATSIAVKYSSSVPGTIDNGTDAFTDMLYDTTVLVGNGDPGQFTRPSVQSLHEVPFTAANSSCSFSNPSANTCYKTNRGTLPFSIPHCTGLNNQQFQGLQPQLSVVQTFGPGQAPLPVFLIPSNGATNGKAAFRFDASSDQWVYQFAVDTLQGRTGTFTGCAFDVSGTVQTFCVRDFRFQTSCP